MVAMTMRRHGVPIGRKDPKLTAKRFSGFAYPINGKSTYDLRDGELFHIITFGRNNINRGIIMAAGREEEWTLSISHDDVDVERWVVALEDIIRDVTR